MKILRDFYVNCDFNEEKIYYYEFVIRQLCYDFR